MRSRPPLIVAVIVALALALVLAACGDDADTATDGRATIAVTTAILADVVDQLVGDQAEVVTIIPLGASPHEFQASARDVSRLTEADAIVVNGGGFEEGLLSVVEAAESDGVPVVDAVVLLGDAAEEDHADEEDHAHDGDAHFFTDPVAMAEVVEGLTVALAGVVPSLDPARLESSSAALLDDLEALDAELRDILSVVPVERRTLVTDHDVFSSFADRYDFEVVGTVIPAGSSSEGVSGGDLARLAALLRTEGVRAVFTEQTASADLAETLAAEVGEQVSVVPLFAESLGGAGSGAETYAAMMRTNAERIADALAG